MKAIFLDRDGVINKNLGYVNCVDDFEIFPGVRNALKLFKQVDYKLIVVTNQGGIDKGFLTEEDLEEIHSKMLEELPEIDDVIFCPDYTSFDRKPSPGMIYKMALKHKINTGESWFIGDRITDMQAGNRAGCKTGFIMSNIQESMRAHRESGINLMADDLLEMAKLILVSEGFILD